MERGKTGGRARGTSNGVRGFRGRPARRRSGPRRPRSPTGRADRGRRRLPPVWRTSRWKSFGVAIGALPHCRGPPPARRGVGRSRRCRPAAAACTAGCRTRSRSRNSRRGWRVALSAGMGKAAIPHRLDPGGPSGRNRLGLQELQAWRRDLGQSAEHFGRLPRFGQFQIENLAPTLDAECQRQRENRLGTGVEPLALRDRNPAAPQCALQAAHQVMMADQAKVAALGEPEAHLGGGGHRLVAVRAPERPLRPALASPALWNISAGWRWAATLVQEWSLCGADPAPCRNRDSSVFP